MSGYSFTNPTGAISPRRRIRVYSSRRPAWTVAGRRFTDYTKACNYADQLNAAGTGPYHYAVPA